MSDAWDEKLRELGVAAGQVTVHFDGHDLLARFEELARLRVQLGIALDLLVPLCRCAGTDPGSPCALVHQEPCPIALVINAPLTRSLTARRT